MKSKSGEKGKRMKTTAELLGELIAVAYECKKHDIFVEYSPHTQSVWVDIHLNRWINNKNADESYTIYLTYEMANEKLKAIIDYIKHLNKEKNK